MFRLTAALSSLLLAVSASAAPIDMSKDIPAESNLGSKILSKARQLNQYYEADFSWIAKFSLKFDKCHSIHLYGGEEAQQEENGSPFGVQHLVQFHLCPSDSSSCGKGGEYVVELGEFVEAYLEVKQELQEAECGKVEENCNCNYYYGDDEACQAKCYADAGLDYCGEDEDGFDPQDYLECREAEFNNNNNQYYNQNKYWIGPLCTGNAIYLALYDDFGKCESVAAKGTWEKYNYQYNYYGKSNTVMPYSRESKESLVDTTPISCEEPQDDNQYYNNNNNNNNGNQYYEAPEPIEFCTELYEQSAKCEKSMSSSVKYYKDDTSCKYIHKVIPALEKVYAKGGGYGGTTTFFAFFFFVTTIVGAAAAGYFYTASKRSSVDLASTSDPGVSIS